MSIALGIDTGGTYTDAVLVEYESNTVLAAAKALTTRHDLSVGIRQAVERVLEVQEADIRLVSVSTTLATNAIVEGNGAPVCTLLIGYSGRLSQEIDPHRDMGLDRYEFIPGGHVTSGDEWEPLDQGAASKAILEHAPHVAAFAVSGYFGTRNPSHELAVKRLVTELSGLPVTCGHELTHRLDAPLRATTVALNARLIPLICDLIDAVEATMASKGIVAPLMVVKGDGSLMESAMARERPIETILSGPAASVVGAQHLTTGEEMVIVDMGGTTTDIAIVSDGRPRLNPQGARVGQWRTMVEAIDVHTVGLGGDSRVWLDREGTLRVGPRRVMPICLVASQHPQIFDAMEAQRARSKAGPADGQFLLFQRERSVAVGNRPSFEPELMASLREGPCSFDTVYRIVKHPELYARYLERLEQEGIVIRAGLTPTDAAHVLGEHRDWDRHAASLAASIFARHLDRNTETLCRQILALASERIASEIVSKILSDEGRNGRHDVMTSGLIAKALRPDPRHNLTCNLTLRPTLVAVGAPVRTYFPAVADLLHSRLSIPDHTGVANAIGAVVGSVVYRTHALILPHDAEGIFRVHLSNEMRDFRDLASAVVYAERQSESLALAGARRAGAEDIRLAIDRTDQSAPVANSWGQELYLQTTVQATAVGRPRLAPRL